MQLTYAEINVDPKPVDPVPKKDSEYATVVS